jgi:hypothetical protein
MSCFVLEMLEQFTLSVSIKHFSEFCRLKKFRRGALMPDDNNMSAKAGSNPPLTARDLWTNPGKMQNWLRSVFETIQTTPSDEAAGIIVPPYGIRYDHRNLFTPSLLAPLSLRPRDATVSEEEFKRLFCDTFLNSFDSKGNGTETFVPWASSMILDVGEENEFLDYTPADFIRDHLLYMAKNDSLSTSLGIANQSSVIPLFVSGLFAIHIGGWWQQLSDSIDAHGSVQLRRPFKLIELFLNRFAEECLRFNPVTIDSVKEAMLLPKSGVTHPALEPNEEDVLRALHLASVPNLAKKKRCVLPPDQLRN